jgi:hypothetical protein
MGKRRSRRGPKAKGAIDMHPRSGIASSAADRSNRVKAAAIHIAGLNADNRAIIQWRQEIRTHPP